MKKLIATIITCVFLVSSACGAFAISPDSLPQIQVDFNQSSEGLKVGIGEYGGITLLMPKGHKDMSISFTWNEGGFVDYQFYDYSGNCVWDSYKDSSLGGFNLCTHEYSLSRYQPVRTYLIGSNVEKVVVYCSEGDQICSSQSGFNTGFNAGISEKGASAGLSFGFSYGKSCTETRYYASITYGNIRNK